MDAHLKNAQISASKHECTRLLWKVYDTYYTCLVPEHIAPSYIP